MSRIWELRSQHHFPIQINATGFFSRYIVVAFAAIETVVVTGDAVCVCVSVCEFVFQISIHQWLLDVITHLLRFTLQCIDLSFRWSRLYFFASQKSHKIEIKGNSQFFIADTSTHILFQQQIKANVIGEREKKTTKHFRLQLGWSHIAVLLHKRDGFWTSNWHTWKIAHDENVAKHMCSCNNNKLISINSQFNLVWCFSLALTLAH